MTSHVESTVDSGAPVGRPGPLAALALVVIIPATFVLSDPESIARRLFDGQAGIAYGGAAGRGLLVFVAGLGMVLLIGRGTLGVVRTLVLAIATWAAIALSTAVLFFATFAGAFACNGQTTHPWNAYVAVAAGVVYVVLGFSALRKGWWWGPPVAVVLALVFGFLLAQAFSGVPHPGDCSD
jgi:hypothetical protein